MTKGHWDEKLEINAKDIKVIGGIRLSFSRCGDNIKRRKMYGTNLHLHAVYTRCMHYLLIHTPILCTVVAAFGLKLDSLDTLII